MKKINLFCLYIIFFCISCSKNNAEINNEFVDKEYVVLDSLSVFKKNEESSLEWLKNLSITDVVYSSHEEESITTNGITRSYKKIKYDDKETGYARSEFLCSGKMLGIITSEKCFLYNAPKLVCKTRITIPKNKIVVIQSVEDGYAKIVYADEKTIVHKNHWIEQNNLYCVPLENEKADELLLKALAEVKK